MNRITLSDTVDGSATEVELAQALQVMLKHAPSVFAVTNGPGHTLVFANTAFRHLIGDSSYRDVPTPIVDVLVPEATVRLKSLMDRAFTGVEPLHDRFLGRVAQGNDYWNCTIWPLCHITHAPRGLVIELHKTTHPLTSLTLQREVAERLLLAALHEADVADSAAESLARSEFLAAAGARLGHSLDTTRTRDAVAGLSLPVLGTWCIVDLIEADRSVSRLAMIHPDPGKQELLRVLARNWAPEGGDPFGSPAISAAADPVVLTDNVEAALEAAAHSLENLRLLRALGIGAILTVPMVSGERLVGALTFLSDKRGRGYSAPEIQMAQSLAARSTEALESARIYGEALLLREQAELATQNKLRFLGNISHELRTPLNAIIGYVDLIEEEIHGPVTADQHRDLGRIRLNQAHLLTLVNELLAFVRAGTPRINQLVDLRAHEAVVSSVVLLENIMARKSITYKSDQDDPEVVALGDPERVRQILVNLLANAVKFTPPGGHITTSCKIVQDEVHISVGDNGIGIADSELEAIFEPFVQVEPSNPAEGVGLGLAISRDLARTMQGDLMVESKLGGGTCFTLTLPRGRVRRSPILPVSRKPS